MSFTIDDLDFAYLNLACRPDRRAHAEKEFVKHGIAARRVEGQLITKENFTPDDKTRRMYNRTPGAIACWRGQVEIIETSDDRHTVVCEDDVCFASDLPKRIEYLSEHVPDDWEILWLGATFHCNPAVWHKNTFGYDARRVSERIFRTFGCWSTYAYIVRELAKDRVLRLLDEYQEFSDGIDHCFIVYLEPLLKTYCFVPGLCWQYDNQSNIGSGVTEFSLFKKNLGPYCWADKIDDFDPNRYDFAEAGYR